MEAIIEGKEDMAIQVMKVAYILERIISPDNVSMLAVILDRIPYPNRHEFAVYVILGNWVYPNYVRTLVSLNHHGLGALPLLDLLVHPDDNAAINQAAFWHYLQFLSSKQI